YVPPPPQIEQDQARLIQGSIARMYGVIPISQDGTMLNLIALDPFNSQIVDDLTFALNKDVNIMVSDPAAVERLVKNTYGEDDASVEDLLRELDSLSIPEGDAEKELEAVASETPII